MRVGRWNPEKFEGELMNTSMDRLRKATNLLADNVRDDCPVGTITRPIYKKGPYANAKWTKRDGGSLKRSVRVTEKKGAGELVASFGPERNIRVYTGNYYAYYAAIVESTHHFMMKAINRSKAAIKSILENG